MRGPLTNDRMPTIPIALPRHVSLMSAIACGMSSVGRYSAPLHWHVTPMRPGSVQDSPFCLTHYGTCALHDVATHHDISATSTCTDSSPARSPYAHVHSISLPTPLLLFPTFTALSRHFHSTFTAPSRAPFRCWMTLTSGSFHSTHGPHFGHLPYMFTVCSRPISQHFTSTFTAPAQHHSQHIHGPFTAHSRPIHGPFTAHSQHIHSTFTAHSQRIHSAFTVHSQCIHSAFTALAQCIHSAFTAPFTPTYTVFTADSSISPTPSFHGTSESRHLDCRPIVSLSLSPEMVLWGRASNTLPLRCSCAWSKPPTTPFHTRCARRSLIVIGQSWGRDHAHRRRNKCEQAAPRSARVRVGKGVVCTARQPKT